MTQCPFNVSLLESGQTFSFLLLDKVSETASTQLHTYAELVFVLPAREIPHGVLEDLLI